MSYDPPTGAEKKIVENLVKQDRLWLDKMDDDLHELYPLMPWGGDSDEKGDTGVWDTAGMLKGHRSNDNLALACTLPRALRSLRNHVKNIRQHAQKMLRFAGRMEALHRQSKAQMDKANIIICPSCHGQQGSHHFDEHSINRWTDCARCEGRGSVVKQGTKP